MELELNDYPELLTVEEAAAYLRISRTLGYQLARQYRTTDGLEGLPVIRLGRCLRVPRRELAKLVDSSEVPGAHQLHS
jgi:excisionase family DNA binding protein